MCDTHFYLDKSDVYLHFYQDKNVIKLHFYRDMLVHAQKSKYVCPVIKELRRYGQAENE
jgi:hypothetical protein